MGRSGVIPAWKIRRELLRFGQQLRAIPEALWEPVAQRRHDAAFERGFAVNHGAVAAAEKIALVLIWQPKGIAESLLETCKHLVANGYAPFIVSNAKLLPDDRSKLFPYVWLMLERPNFGYDFGGYRDGLRQLDRMQLLPRRLVILNDSIWYPLQSEDDSLARMEASGADVVGTVLRVRGEERFLESYFYSLPQSTLRHAAFKTFWQDLRLTSNKYKVIRRGERGFSAAMRAAGLQLVGLFDQKTFLTHVEKADDSTLRDILRYAATMNPIDKAEARQLSSGQAADFAVNARALIVRMLRKGQFYSTFPIGAFRLMHYPVLKKSREPASACWRAAYLGAVADGQLPPPSDSILHEAQAITDISSNTP